MSQKLVWINGSPKPDKESASHQMIEYLSNTLTSHYDSMLEVNALKLSLQPTKLTEHFKEVLSAHVMVIVAPLYADSMPSGLLDYLYQFESFIKTHPECCMTHPLKVYGYINCGFIGGYQNHIALEIIEHFAHRMNFTWCGGLGVGSGAMLAGTLYSVPKEAKMQRPIYEGLDAFIAALQSQEAIPNSNKQLLVTQDFSPSLFNFALNMNWMAQSGWKFRKIYDKPYLNK